jgi:hypothetical protein
MATRDHAKVFEEHVGMSHKSKDERDKRHVKERALWKLEEYHAVAQGRPPSFQCYGHLPAWDAKRLIDSYRRELRDREARSTTIAVSRKRLRELTEAVGVLLPDVDVKKFRDFLAKE